MGVLGYVVVQWYVRYVNTFVLYSRSHAAPTAAHVTPTTEYIAYFWSLFCFWILIILVLWQLCTIQAVLMTISYRLRMRTNCDVVDLYFEISVFRVLFNLVKWVALTPARLLQLCRIPIHASQIVKMFVKRLKRLVDSSF